MANQIDESGVAAATAKATAPTTVRTGNFAAHWVFGASSSSLLPHHPWV